MYDVTANLRCADEALRDRVRYLAGTIYERALTDRGLSSVDEFQRLAKKSIEASCSFWQEWEIAAMVESVEKVEPPK